MNRRTLPVAWLLAAALAAPVSAAAPQREFLSDSEIGQLREVQDPSDRIRLYMTFAKDRLDALDKELARESAERAGAIHDLLSEYDRIVDAAGDTVDLAATRHALVRKGLAVAVKEMPEFLKRLRAVEAKNPKDIEEYRFILEQAIETTVSGLEDFKGELAKLPLDRKAEKELEKEERKRKNANAKEPQEK